MHEKYSTEKDDAVCVYIPQALYDRVEAYCTTRSIAPHEFILDAVSEKLASVHQERRKKPRL